jgi:hypothetical protein
MQSSEGRARHILQRRRERSLVRDRLAGKYNAAIPGRFALPAQSTLRNAGTPERRNAGTPDRYIHVFERSSHKKSPVKTGLSYLLQRNSHFAVASEAAARRVSARRRERTPGTRSSRVETQRRRCERSRHKKSPARAGLSYCFDEIHISPSRAKQLQGGF